MSDYVDCFMVLIDVNVLVCVMCRNIILLLVEVGFFWFWWSDRIMDEIVGVIVKIMKGGVDINK